MILRANCKINIGLDVLRRREDGYHDVETAMVPVRGLYDEVRIVRAPDGGVTFAQSGLAVDCPAEENICVKAFRLMQRHYGIGGLKIELDKRVPFGAGLGGGSADGTAVVRAADELYGLQLPEEELIARAAELGSDTAFFVRNTPQLCTGRGERMEPVALPLAGLWLVLVKPDEGVSTREAYAGVTPAVPARPLAEWLREEVAQWQGCVKNDFEPSVFARHPRLAAVKTSLLAQGALYAAMSGSGSTLFGLFASEPRYRPPFPGLFLHTERF